MAIAETLWRQRLMASVWESCMVAMTDGKLRGKVTVPESSVAESPDDDSQHVRGPPRELRTESPDEDSVHGSSLVILPVKCCLPTSFMVPCIHVSSEWSMRHHRTWSAAVTARALSGGRWCAVVCALPPEQNGSRASTGLTGFCLRCPKTHEALNPFPSTLD